MNNLVKVTKHIECIYVLEIEVSLWYCGWRILGGIVVSDNYRKNIFFSFFYCSIILYIIH